MRQQYLKSLLCKTKNVILAALAAVIAFSHSKTLAANSCQQVFELTETKAAHNQNRTWTENQANHFASKLIAHYEKQLAANNRNVMLKIDWDRGDFDSRVHNDGLFDNIHLSGSIFRRPDIDPDMIALIIGHELGHLIGKRTPLQTKEEYAVEGEADYFAAKAFKEFYQEGLLDQNFDTQSEAAQAARDSYSQKKNIVGWGPQKEDVFRAMTAAFKVLTLDQPNPAKIDFESRDATTVQNTITDYPSLQSRLDTTRQGILDFQRPASWALESHFGKLIDFPSENGTPANFSNKIETSIDRPKSKNNLVIKKLFRLLPRSLRTSKSTATASHAGLMSKSYEHRVNNNAREMGLVQLIDKNGAVIASETVYGEYHSIRLGAAVNKLLNRHSNQFSEIAKITTVHTHPLDLKDDLELTSVFSDADKYNQNLHRKNIDGDVNLRHIDLEHSIVYFNSDYINKYNNTTRLYKVLTGQEKIQSDMLEVLTFRDPG